MTEDIQSLRNSLFDSSTSAQRYLYSHPDSGQNLKILAQQFGISEGLYRDFVLLVGDVVLGIQKTADLPLLLKQVLGVDDQTSNNITRDVLDFLAPLSDPSWHPPVTEADDIASQMSAAEETLAAKFATPTIQEAVYTSTQSAILQEGSGPGQWGSR